MRAAVLLLVLACAGVARADDFVVGYNQAWQDGKFGTDLSSRFDEAEWRKTLARTRESGGSVLRVWLFEGAPMDGVAFAGSRAVGVDPAFLRNVRRLAELAAAEQVQIYWTGHDGNSPGNLAGNADSERFRAVLGDASGSGVAFREKVLAPVLDAIRSKPGTVYAFDVINEVEGAVKARFFADRWEGARRYIAATTAFVHSQAPGVRVASSAGHGEAAADVLAGRFDGLDLDLLDVHLYQDDESVAEGPKLVAHARALGVPIILGEVGQAKKGVDPALQARVLRGILADAKHQGFAAVLAWRLVDTQPADVRFSFWDGDRPRPAIEEMKRSSRKP
jgi:hypothetical protein